MAWSFWGWMALLFGGAVWEKLLFLLLLHAQVGGAGSYRDIAYREKHQRIRAGLYI